MHVFHKTLCLPPPPAPVQTLQNFFIISIGVLQWSQEGKKTMLMQFLGEEGEGGGQTRCIMGDVQMVNGMIHDSIMNF